MHSTQHIDTFNARIKRIQDPRFTYVVDPESGIKIPRRLTRDQIGRRPAPPTALLTMAAILGGICLLIVRFVRMEVASAPYVPDMMIEVAMAGMAAVVIGGLFRMQSFHTVAAQIAGALICAVSMHNAVWIAPDPFAQVFTQSYVDGIKAMTDPMTLYINGVSYALPS